MRAQVAVLEDRRARGRSARRDQAGQAVDWCSNGRAGHSHTRQCVVRPLSGLQRTAAALEYTQNRVEPWRGAVDLTRRSLPPRRASARATALPRSPPESTQHADLTNALLSVDAERGEPVAEVARWVREPRRHHLANPPVDRVHLREHEVHPPRPVTAVDLGQLWGAERSQHGERRADGTLARALWLPRAAAVDLSTAMNVRRLR